MPRPTRSRADAVRAGHAFAVDVGRAGVGDELVFVNTFAVGVYPELVAERERREDTLGTWPALALAILRILHRARPVRLRVDGQDRTLWTLFAGNGHYHPAGFAPSWRDRLDAGIVDVRLIDGAAPWARTRLALAVLTGRLGRSRAYEQRVVAELVVQPLEDDLSVALDGELHPAPQEMRLRARGPRLVVYRPPR